MLSSGIAHIRTNDSHCICKLCPAQYIPSHTSGFYLLRHRKSCSSWPSPLSILDFDFPDSLLFVGNVEPTGFAFCMLNLWSTFVTYFSCNNHNDFFVMSRTMCIPRICFESPISFITNDLLKAFFKLLIFFELNV